jgi:hypothetical protein
MRKQQLHFGDVRGGGHEGCRAFRHVAVRIPTVVEQFSTAAWAMEWFSPNLMCSGKRLAANLYSWLAYSLSRVI